MPSRFHDQRPSQRSVPGECNGSNAFARNAGGARPDGADRRSSSGPPPPLRSPANCDMTGKSKRQPALNGHRSSRVAIARELLLILVQAAGVSVRPPSGAHCGLTGRARQRVQPQTKKASLPASEAKIRMWRTEARLEARAATTYLSTAPTGRPGGKLSPTGS
jgi:hypothetical protein